MATNSNPSNPATSPGTANPSTANPPGIARHTATSPPKPTLLDELTFTLGELNKAMDNVNYMAETFKELDLAKLLKGASKTKWKELLKHIDLKQVQSFLESPLVQQIIADPELLSLFVPQLGSNGPHSQQPVPDQQGASQHPPSNPLPQYSTSPMMRPAQPHPSQPVVLTKPYHHGPYKSLPYSAYQPLPQQGHYHHSLPAPTARLKSQTRRSK